MAAITTCRNWTAMHNSAPVGPPSRSRAIRWSLFEMRDRKSTRLNSSHGYISYAVFCLKKKKTHHVKSLHALSSTTAGIELHILRTGLLVYFDSRISGCVHSSPCPVYVIVVTLDYVSGI